MKGAALNILTAPTLNREQALIKNVSEYCHASWKGRRADRERAIYTLITVGLANGTYTLSGNGISYRLVSSHANTVCELWDYIGNERG